MNGGQMPLNTHVVSLGGAHTSTSYSSQLVLIIHTLITTQSSRELRKVNGI
jgi:hypothetical protein